MLTLKIPNYHSSNSWVSWLQLKRDKAKQLKPKELRIDFNSCGFLTPYKIASLACLIEELHILDTNIEFAPCTADACQYLSEIQFWNYWREGFDRNKFTQNSKATSLCLWKINQPMLAQYVDVATQYFENNHLTGKDLTPMNISLAESFNNIFDHSESKVQGYTISQFFPNIHQIEIAVCDFGIGIPSCIQNIDKFSGLESHEALEMAFKRKVSARTKPHNVGLGLDNLRTNIVETGGKIEVLSNDDRLTSEGIEGVKVAKIDSNFVGTLIFATLHTKKLDALELENEGIDFYF